MMQVDLYGFQLIGDLPPSEDTGALIWLYDTLRKVSDCIGLANKPLATRWLSKEI